MDKEEFRIWQDDVLTHTHTMQTLANDRLILKEMMTNHLKQFFDFEEIHFTNDFNKITLKWKYQDDPVILDGSLEELGMDFIISHAYDSILGEGIVIELYPFGLEDGE